MPLNVKTLNLTTNSNWFGKLEGQKIITGIFKWRPHNKVYLASCCSTESKKRVLTLKLNEETCLNKLYLKAADYTTIGQKCFLNIDKNGSSEVGDPSLFLPQSVPI